MYKGNIEQTLRLKYESELQLYWVTLIRKTLNPDSHELEISRDLQWFTPDDWNNLWIMQREKGVTWLQIIDYSDYEILHDPTLPFKIEDLEVEY